MANAEALFLIDDKKSDFFVFHPGRKEAVCADEDVDVAIANAFENLAGFGGGLESAQEFNPNRVIAHS